MHGSSCATIFSEWIKEQEYDVLIVDSDIIQIGILTAGMLKIPAVSYVYEIRPIEQQHTLWIRQQFEHYFQNLKIMSPCLLSVLPKQNQSFYMNVDGITKAYSIQIPVISVDKILQQKGIKIIKTHQYNCTQKESRHLGRVLSVPVDKAINAILELLLENHILNNHSTTNVLHDQTETLLSQNSFSGLESQIEFLEVEVHKERNINITEASIIVSGGRGLGSAEEFENLKSIAKLLGGAVACSRACVESGWMDAAFQVGQSGKTVCPNLYLACGISGAFQHITGMSGSKLIISINKNPAAPIFDISDLGIIGDVKVILPRLIEALQEHKK